MTHQGRHIDYLDLVFEPKDFITIAHEKLDGIANEFDGFVGTGLSGTLACAMLAVSFDKPYAIMRKDAEISHSHHKIEAGFFDGRWLFVDDLVASGKTFHNVFRAVVSEMGSTHFAGWYLFSRGRAELVADADEFASVIRSTSMSQTYETKLPYWYAKEEQQACT